MRWVGGWLVLALCACDDGGGDADAARPRVGDARPGDDADAAQSPVGDAQPAGDAAAAPDLGPDAAIPDAGPACATLCFSNDECAPEDRCENTAPDGAIEVPCCVPGPRGDRPAGAECGDGDGQLLCASGVCVEGDDAALCSTRCEDEADCPPTMQRCFPIGFDDGRDPEAWCFPN